MATRLIANDGIAQSVDNARSDQTAWVLQLIWSYCPGIHKDRLQDAAHVICCIEYKTLKTLVTYVYLTMRKGEAPQL